MYGKVWILIGMWVGCITAWGQNVNKVLFPTYSEYTRMEVRMPQEVNGFMVLKADLHTHTYFSDGSVSPDMRVDEAWKTGLDVLAITDHIEYKTNRQYISGDDNVSHQLAEKRAKDRGIILIKGSEITRKQPIYGHFNALFLKDANRLKVDDPKEAIREAVRQGAFVFWNHPAWAVDTCRMYDFQRELLDEGLVQGIEVFNNIEFYPRALRWANERGLTMFAGSDVHTTVYANDGVQGAGCAVSTPYHRPMTLILAKECSQEAIKEALLARRTLAYFGGHLAGNEALLTDFFWACITVKVVTADDKRITYRLTNHYAVPFYLAYGKNRVALYQDRSVDIRLPKTDEILKLKLENAFIDEGKTLTVSLPLK